MVILPVSTGLIYATSYSLGLTGLMSQGFTTAYWGEALSSQDVWSSFLYSLWVGIVSVFIAACIALGLALGWQRSIQQGKLSYFIFLPLCYPATVMAFLVHQWFSPSGFFSRLFYNLGIIDNLEAFPIVIRDYYGIGIILCSIFLITPFFTILFSNIYKNERINELENLSKTLGSSVNQILRRVTLPILFNRSKTTLLLFVIFVMGSYEAPLILGRQNPQMITVAIVNKIQKFNLNDIPVGYAMSIIYVLIVIISLNFSGILKTFQNRKISNI